MHAGAGNDVDRLLHPASYRWRGPGAQCCAFHSTTAARVTHTLLQCMTRVCLFDKTYNLGCMFVTVSTYRNLSMEHVRSGAAPTFIRPLFVHVKSTTETYVFNSIARWLQDANLHISRTSVYSASNSERTLAIDICQSVTCVNCDKTR